MVSTAAMPAQAEPPASRYCLAIRGRFAVLQGDKDPIGLGIEVAERPLGSSESEGAIAEGTQRLPHGPAVATAARRHTCSSLSRIPR